jgi:hypothetical protein
MSVHRRVEARNRGLDRVSRLTTLTLSGGLVLSGGFAALAGHAYAGHSRRSVPSLVGNTRARATGSVTPGGTVAPLTAPQTVPQAAPQTVPQTVPQYNYQYQPPPDPVVSGGS